MDAGNGRIRWPYQDGAAFDDLITVLPVVPEARQSQCLPIGALEVPGLLFASFQWLPFVETRRGDDAAAVCPRFPKGGAFGLPFRSVC